MANHNTLEDDLSGVSFMYSLIDSTLVRIQSIRGREALRTHHATFLACLLLGVVVLHLNVHPVLSSSTIYIRADGRIDPPSAPISTTNNIIYTLTNNIYDEIVVEKNDIVINGASYTVQGSGTGNGFTLYSVTNVTLTNINIKNFAYGIYLESSSYNSIHRNIISGNDYDGIEVYFSSDYNNITENRIEENGWFGIGIHYSNNNTINANEIADNDDGIDAYDASRTEISWNNITGNGEFGIGLYSSSDNKVFLNNFLNNTQHVYSQYSTNRWDKGYPSGGNYWSNYIGLDMYEGQYQNETGIDGIGDTAFTIDSSNKDRYPLMNPWMQPSPGHDVAVINAWPSKTVIGQGYNGDITVFGANKGEYAETFNLTVYIESVAFASWTLHLEGGLTATIRLSWNTTDFSKKNYTISASATAVPGETDSTDNNCTWTVHVGVPGDVSGSTTGVYDGTVNMRDISYIILVFNTKPSSSKWNPNADVNNDLIVNMRDISITILNFNKHE